MFDLNGLQLTPCSDSMNAYRLTAVNVKERKYAAYALPRHDKTKYNMETIAMYKDPRDAAYVAQEFEKKYSKDQIRQMMTDKTFREAAQEFIANIEIPEWQYPAEGLSFEDILGEVYTRNYVNNAKDALLEVLKAFKLKTPDMKTAKVLMAKVEEMVKQGLTYRLAAKQVMGV